MNGWYKALEDRIWLTQLGLNILLPLVLCLGAAGGPVWILTAALPAAPEESKETAPGFRGTRLWNQSLVCYTFAKERAARGQPLASF